MIEATKEIGAAGAAQPPLQMVASPPPPTEEKPAVKPLEAGDRTGVSADARDDHKTPGASPSLLASLENTFSNDGGPVVSREKLAAMSEGETEELKRLRERHDAVREHEEDHHRVAGEFALGGPSYTDKLGPDGNYYHDGGEVPIDVAETDDPEKTVKKMRQVREAALAPSHNVIAPLSDADKTIAAEASVKEANAQAKLDEQRKTV